MLLSTFPAGMFFHGFESLYFLNLRRVVRGETSAMASSGISVALRDGVRRSVFFRSLHTVLL